MARDKQFTIKIESIMGGQSAFQNFAVKGQFGDSLALDPDLPATSGDPRASGFPVPVPSTKVSSTTITNPPLWIIPNPKRAWVHVYDSGGKVYSMTGAGVVVAYGTTLTAASGNGSAYYDNYMYYATNTDITRHGPLNGARTVNQVYWTSTLSKTALVNTTYPTAQRPAITYPNHPMHVHEPDNKLYFGDVVGNQGVIHFIKTSKTTVEGDTNDGSTYNALDLPYGWWPTDIESLGTDLVISVFEGNVAGNFAGGRSGLVIWDTLSASWQRFMPMPDEYISALLNVNGVIYIFSGNLNGTGVRISVLAGGYTVTPLGFLQDSCPPFPGAVDHKINRIIFGGFADHLNDYGCVWAMGSKARGFENSLFNIMRATATTGTGTGVTALLYAESSGFLTPKQFAGWSDGSAYGIDLPNTTYGRSILRSDTFRVGEPFKITEVHIPLAQAVGANMTLIPTLYMDDRSSTTALTTINNTNYTASERHIWYPNVEVYGKNNFMFELKLDGTALLTPGLPIIIKGEYLIE